MRKPIIIANWKMNKTIQDAVRFIQHLKEIIAEQTDIDIVVAPPYTALSEVNAILKSSLIRLGAQDVFWEDEGAFTGEVSVVMLKDVGCRYVIIGHSEQRHTLRHDTNETVNRKVRSAIKHNLQPILCVGETLQEREKGKTNEVVSVQLQKALEGLSGQDAKNIVIAYEPVWAIGTGKTPTPQSAQDVHSYIRRLLSDMYDYGISSNITIVYGGSVKPDNIMDFMKQEDIDGALVGGSSLDLESFAQIIRNSARVKLCMP